MGESVDSKNIAKFRAPLKYFAKVAGSTGSVCASRTERICSGNDFGKADFYTGAFLTAVTAGPTSDFSPPGLIFGP